MPAEDAPRVAMSMDEVDANVSRFASGYEVVAVKSDLGTSGRGIERLVGPATPAQRRAIERRLRRDGCVIVEPWVDRVCDLSFRFTRAGDGTVGLDDIGRFLTDERGQYRGAVLGRATTGLPSEVRRFVAELGPQGLDDVAQRVADGLAADPAYAGIEGPLGVDAMIYRQPTGRLALRPVVEVNPRHNMGHVAWRIGQCVAPGRAAVWMIIGQTTVPGGDLRGFVERCVEANPPVLRRDGQTRRLDAGVVPTSDPATAKRCVAMLSVARTLRDALSAVDQRMIG
jgi:hypothetical protein